MEMIVNEHGFEVGQEFELGGIGWTIIGTGIYCVKCISTQCVGRRAFDTGDENNFAASSLCDYLNGEFLQRLIASGAPKEMFIRFRINLMSDDGLNDYGVIEVKVGLVTCEEYRLCRSDLPPIQCDCWATATSSSPGNAFVRFVGADGSLNSTATFFTGMGIRPVIALDSRMLREYLDGSQVTPDDDMVENQDLEIMKKLVDVYNYYAEREQYEDGSRETQARIQRGRVAELLTDLANVTGCSVEYYFCGTSTPRHDGVESLYVKAKVVEPKR